MSGGVAWVLDLRTDRLNTELVDAVPLSADDLIEVSNLLARHAELTGSTIARELLDGGPELIAQRLTTVLPRDYAKVLRAQAEARAAGLDEAATTELMMEAAHG